MRFLTAGSVDDGKSTLIGRLLHDSGSVYEDELASVLKTSSLANHKLDPSLITDGLRAEREQGITIDVAYRYFFTPRRKFIIADTPGHEQYTRNMATGASTAQAAVLLMDARKGVLPQTRRHLYIVWLLGIRVIIVAVNKMDLLGFDAEAFQRIRKDFLEFVAPLELDQLRFVPISALEGDNVIALSDRMSWYKGPSLLQILESVQVPQQQLGYFRFPVQTVIRAADDFRGYAGQIASGRIRPGDKVLALPSRRYATVDRVLNHTRDLHIAFAPMSVVVSLKEHLDLGRGDMLCDPHSAPSQTKHFRARLIWMSTSPMRVSEPYLIKHTTQTACMSILKPAQKIDIHTLKQTPEDSLRLNEIGEVEIETHKPIFCDPYSVNRQIGGFVVLDPLQNTTLAAGIISHPHVEVSDNVIAASSGTASLTADRGLTVWMTGLSGSGKTTICQAVQTELLARGISVEMLDGDVIRRHLSRELGFSKSDRDENIRRIGFVAELLTRNGVIVLVSAISPYRAVRDEIRSTIGNFIEVFVNAPLEICERRDPKGLYKKARAGKFQSFTGVDDPYEPPFSPEIECRTDLENVKESVDKVVAKVLSIIHWQHLPVHGAVADQEISSDIVSGVSTR